jgi:staphylococcal nuclease domain-containing protein 1
LFSEEKDEPFAWEAREFLRKKLIGQEVAFFSKPFPNSSNSSDRELGKIFYPTKEDDIAEELVANGLARVKKEKTSGKQAQEPDIKKLIELEEKAKSEGKGIWSKDKDKVLESYVSSSLRIIGGFYVNKFLPSHTACSANEVSQGYQ